jgi:hypothetical protein
MYLTTGEKKLQKLRLLCIVVGIVGLPLNLTFKELVISGKGLVEKLQVSLPWLAVRFCLKIN